MWPTFPQTGLDDRNQFDWIRSMPGGLSGVRAMVAAFHAEGVKVLLPYNPVRANQPLSLRLRAGAQTDLTSDDLVVGQRHSARALRRRTVRLRPWFKARRSNG